MIHEKYASDICAALKDMQQGELCELASKIREKLIDSVSKRGGHLASNLGVVELTIALHRVFNSPKDKIVWDVGHQSYVHKMLTGRWEAMDGLRQLGGISGFPKRSESEHDMYDSGHSGTSISAALGYAAARDLSGGDYSCIAVIGDGAITGGVAYEALCGAGSSKTPLIVVLNDNGMSISGNVGGMSRHLVKLRTWKRYIRLKEGVKRRVTGSPRIYRLLEHIRNSIRRAFVPDNVFDGLGFKYYGPVDGHDIDALCKTLEAAKMQHRPVLVHVLTKKGCGFKPAEQNPAKFHGIGSFDPARATSEEVQSAGSWSDVFGQRLNELAAKDRDIVAITAAMLSATGLCAMQKAFPERVFDAAIAEQHAVSFAAGLALGGKKPVAAIYSTFLQRAYDQILVEVCLQNLPVVFAIDRAGLTGPDGETHQGVFDIAYLRSMPNMTLLSPRSAQELREMLSYALALGSPCAVRYPRGSAVSDNAFKGCGFMEPELIMRGNDVLFISSGSMIAPCFSAAEALKKKGLSCGLINLRCLKPLPEDYIINALRSCKLAVTVEDGVVQGGFGQAISAISAEMSISPRVINLGWPDVFIQHGSPEELAAMYGLDAAGIARRVEGEFEKTTRFSSR